MPGYKYAGKHPTRKHYYMPADDDELRAKFAYFREAEAGINGGPVPIHDQGECGTNGGYMKHCRREEERCDPCKMAHAAVEMDGYWKRKRTMRQQSPCDRFGNTQMTSKIGSTRQHKSGPGMCYQHESGA